MLSITKELQSEVCQRLISAHPLLEQLKPDSFSQILGGADTAIFSFDMISDSEKVPLILRIHRPAYTSSARKEFRVMEGLQKAGFRIPKPYVFVDNSSVIDRAYLVIERIEGRLLSDEVFESYPGPRFDRLLQEYMKNMTTLHSIDWSRDLSFLDSWGVNTNPSSFIDYELTRPRKLVREYRIDELAPVIEWMETNRVESSGTCLIHGDYHLMNVIVRKDDDLVTIDWTNAQVGDFRADLGFAIVAIDSGGLDVKEKMVAEYEMASKKRVENIEYFMVLSNLHNLLRFYSAAFDHRITGESEELTQLLIHQYRNYARHLTTITQEITGVPLTRLLEFIG